MFIKKHSKKLMMLAATGIVAFPLAVNAASTTIDATARFLQKITLDTEEAMDFGTIEYSAAPGLVDTVTMTTAGGLMFTARHPRLLLKLAVRPLTSPVFVWPILIMRPAAVLSAQGLRLLPCPKYWAQVQIPSYSAVSWMVGRQQVHGPMVFMRPQQVVHRLRSTSFINKTGLDVRAVSCISAASPFLSPHLPTGL